MNMTSALLSAPSGVVDDEIEDGCSICLEPFTSLDPPSVTVCKHEYHLHCILEWSQRRIECPVCSQYLVLKDPASQELLAGAENEKNLKLRQKFNSPNQNNEINNNSPNVDESDNEQRIAGRFAVIANRARNITGRRSQSTSANPGKSNSSEFVAFSDSVMSKISTASIRYKESISKSTRSLKEKLITRNDSVKELSRGVQREMSAGIAGITKIIAQKRAANSSTN